MPSGFACTQHHKRIRPRKGSDYIPFRKYEVPKKTLQLEVKRVAAGLGHLPSRVELMQHGKYPIWYYDEYFVSWGEVCAAARTTGMAEIRPAPLDLHATEEFQLPLELAAK